MGLDSNHPGCFPSYLFYFSNSSPIELYVKRLESLWLRQTLFVHSCRYQLIRKGSEHILKQFHLKLFLKEFSQGNHVMWWLTDTEEMFNSRVIHRAALVAIWRQAAGAVMGRGQVYMSAWLTVTCADEGAAAYEPCSPMCRSRYVCVSVYFHLVLIKWCVCVCVCGIFMYLKLWRD